MPMTSETIEGRKGKLWFYASEEIIQSFKQ